MKKNRLFTPLGLALFVSSLALGIYLVAREGRGLKEEAQAEISGEAPLVVRITDRIRPQETLYEALRRQDLSPQEIAEITQVLGRMVDFKAIQAGDGLVLEKNLRYAQSTPPITLFELVRQEADDLPVRYQLLRDEQNEWWVNRIEIPVTQERMVLSGRVSSSLYEGIMLAGGDPALVNRFSDLFGWKVDFYREAQPGDEFKMIVEAKYAQGRCVGFGRVIAAEYSNSGRIFRGFRFEADEHRVRGFYDEEGQSLEGGFLKSPVSLARITSRYGQRFHPVLKRRTKHNGVDYGASRGTPFWSIADGVVLEARYSPTAGRMVRIQHRSGYITEYFHAHKIASGIRPGVHVKQKQIIGYVGSTGRSTGPHLHFGMMHHKRYVDPGRQRFPAGDPLPSKLASRYADHIKPLLEELKNIEVS
ncbi:MAG: M23 family metallopeptidase [Deltaproteobacteria bacterium]|nr:M23 family metallopeptidase [Deltaproteobacteria bacterium]